MVFYFVLIYLFLLYIYLLIDINFIGLIVKIVFNWVVCGDVEELRCIWGVCLVWK